MDKAKAAVSDFLHKSGKHDTTVEEQVAPAVVHEQVNPHRHENVTTAVDKEIHQDHYHTSVQPIQHREVLPEKHEHNVIPVEHRAFDHGSSKDDESRLAREAAQFRDERAVADTTHTHSVAPAVAGEHIHHHVHETIQPVLQKETIQPHVVHTTVPIHEVHNNASQHHSTSALPAVSLTDFKKQGGTLEGRETRYDGFAGEPKSVGGALSSHHTSGTTGTTGTAGTTGTTGTSGLSGTTGTTGTTGTSGLSGTGHNTSTAGTTGTSGLSSETSHNTGTTGTTGTSGLSGTGHNTSTTGTTGTTGTTDSTDSTTGTTKKASLMDKINPKIDADGDGKAGFMK